MADNNSSRGPLANICISLKSKMIFPQVLSFLMHSIYFVWADVNLWWFTPKEKAETSNNVAIKTAFIFFLYFLQKNPSFQLFLKNGPIFVFKLLSRKILFKLSSGPLFKPDFYPNSNINYDQLTRFLFSSELTFSLDLLINSDCSINLLFL